MDVLKANLEENVTKEITEVLKGRLMSHFRQALLVDVKTVEALVDMPLRESIRTALIPAVISTLSRDEKNRARIWPYAVKVIEWLSMLAINPEWANSQKEKNRFSAKRSHDRSSSNITQRNRDCFCKRYGH